ncbi:hypothetical protein M9Y10_009774 [Tritrichomonas musculus]|uniref:BEACH domain-containing protein n=1 Tax=Tritrichomonas musculus TaxID=1915356 RepID=A0ABR2IQT4_9EUKA
MTLSRKLIDKLIKFTQSVYRIHLEPPDIPLPQEIINFIPKVEESKILARRQNLNSFVNNAQLDFECRFTLVSTLLGFISSHKLSPSQMQYISLVILQSCCGILFWEHQNIGSHYALVFIRAFCQSAPYLRNWINEMKIFFALFVERIYSNKDIDLLIEYLPAINEVMSKYPQLSENCIQYELKIAKKLCKKLRSENIPINQTNISYFFQDLSKIISRFPHQNFDHTKIIKRLLEISKLPTPTYLLLSYLSLLLSFHCHNIDLIPLLEQISNGLINADSSSIRDNFTIINNVDPPMEIQKILSQKNNDTNSKYKDYFSSENPQIPKIPNLNEIPQSISGAVVSVATEIADHFNNSCKFKDFLDFLYLLLNCSNFNIQAILLICILISGPPLRFQISELFAKNNLWKFLLSEKTFNPDINIFDNSFSRLINLRQSIFDVLAFMCTTPEVILSIRKAFCDFLSKFVQNSKFASEIVLMSYPSLQPIYLVKVPEDEEDEIMISLLEITIIQQFDFFKDPKNVSTYRFPTLSVILSILNLENCVSLVANSEYSCKALLSLLFERPLIPHIEKLIMKLANISSEKSENPSNITSNPFSIALHKLFQLIIGQSEMSDLVLKLLQMIEREPSSIFLENELINDLICAALSCADKDLEYREEILEYFLRILLKFKDFKQFDPTIVPFNKIGNVCFFVGTFITFEDDGSFSKNKLFDILYNICISDDVITLPEALPMLMLSLKDTETQSYMINKLIDLCKNSEINRYSCLVGDIPSIIFNKKYQTSFELYKLITLTVSNPKSLRFFLHCFERDKDFDDALNYLSMIIDTVNTAPYQSKIQFSSQGSHVTFPPISSSILENGFIVHSRLFIESNEPKRNLFILEGKRATFSVKFLHGSLMLQIQTVNSCLKYNIDAEYPLNSWFDLSLMLKPSEGLTIGFDENIIAGISIESVQMSANTEFLLSFFTHFSEENDPKPIQMHSISFYGNFSQDELSISDFVTDESFLQDHLIYTFTADNILNRNLIYEDYIATFSGTPLQFECNFLRSFEVTRSINILLVLFRKVEYKPKLLNPLLSIIFNLIQKSTVVSNQMVKNNGMAVISYFLEKLSSSELSKERWKFFVDQIEKIKSKQLLRLFVKFIFYNFKIWSHASLDVQMQVICDWQQIGIFFEEFLTVPFLLKTFNNFYNYKDSYKFTPDLDNKKNSFFADKIVPIGKKVDDYKYPSNRRKKGNEVTLLACSSLDLSSILQDSELLNKSETVDNASSANSSIPDLAPFIAESSSNLADLNNNNPRLLILENYEVNSSEADIENGNNTDNESNDSISNDSNDNSIDNTNDMSNDSTNDNNNNNENEMNSIVNDNLANYSFDDDRIINVNYDISKGISNDSIISDTISNDNLNNNNVSHESLYNDNASNDSLFSNDSIDNDDGLAIDRSLKGSRMYNESTGDLSFNQIRTPTKRRRAPAHKRSASIESIASITLSNVFRSNSISSLSYQKLIEDKLNSIRKIIISLINSVISLKKLNKKEGLFLFNIIQKAKETEESLNLLEVVSFVIDSKLHISSFDIKGQWIMLFLHRNETFRIRWLNLFSKMYPDPPADLVQSILFLLIIQTQIILNDSIMSNESLLVESIRICLNINKTFDLTKLTSILVDFSSIKIQYFHFAIAIAIAAPESLNDSFTAALMELTTFDDFSNQVATSSTNLTLFLLIYWTLRRSQGEKDDYQFQSPSNSIDSLNQGKNKNDYNKFSFPLKVDSVDSNAVTILARICSFSPSLARTAVGIIDSISTITKANLSQLRSQFLNSLFPIASTPEFIQIIGESIFFHYKIFNLPSLSPLFETYDIPTTSKKRFDAQVPDLITLVNVYIGDIDRSPISYYSLEIDKNGCWADESLAKSLICVATALKNDKLKPILSILIYTFCRRQSQSEIASLIPLVRELITEKDNYSYLIIDSVFRERISSFLDLTSNSSSSFNDSIPDTSTKKRRKTEMVPTMSDEDEYQPLNRRRYSDSFNQFFKHGHDQKMKDENYPLEDDGEEINIDNLNMNSPQPSNNTRVKINFNSYKKSQTKSSNQISLKKANEIDLPKMKNFTMISPFDDDLPESVQGLLKTDPKFIRICYITLTQFCENAPKTLTEVHKSLIEIFSSIQSVFSASTCNKVAIHQPEKYLSKRAWELLWHQMFTGNQVHFKRSSYTDYLSRPLLLRRNFGFDRKLSEIRNAKKTDTTVENCIDSNEPLFEAQCERIKVDKTISGTFYILYTGIHRFNKESIINNSNNQIEKKILRFISDRGKLIVIPVDSVVRILPMFVLQKKTAVEILTEQQRSFLFNFKSVSHVKNFMSQMPSTLQFPTDKFLSILTDSWCKRTISNYEYLTWLNLLSGRTFNTAYAYPVFPWILCDYESSTINLDDPKVYRDLSKPIGALNPVRLQKLKKLRNDNIEEDNNFLYRSTYSCAFHVFHYLVRLEPFTSLHIIMQDGKFDVAHRLFSSILNSYERITSTFFNFRELIPEFFFNSDFLVNLDKFTLGGGIDNVSLPLWAKSPIEFVYKNRRALESETVSAHINEWIDLIWGYKQTGQAAEEADNVFDPHLYPNVWQRYKMNDSMSNDGSLEIGSRAMKNAGILFKPTHRNSFVGTTMTSLSIPSTIENSTNSVSSLASSQSSSLEKDDNHQVSSSSLYKNPTVDPGSVSQSVLNATSRQQIEQLLAHVGQIPQQLFDSPHPTRQPLSSSSSSLLFLLASNSSGSTSGQNQVQQSSSSSLIFTPNQGAMPIPVTKLKSNPKLPSPSSLKSSQKVPSPSSLKTSPSQQKMQKQQHYFPTESILDLASALQLNEEIENRAKNNNDKQKIKMNNNNNLYLDFSSVVVPAADNLPICSSSEKHLTFRLDGRVFNSLVPLTKEKVLYLDHFVNIGPFSFAAVCTSTNEIVRIERESSESAASNLAIPSTLISLQASVAAPVTVNDSDSLIVIRKKSAFHVSAITCICKVGAAIFTGDSDGIVANEETEALLTAHKKSIVCMDGCEALRIIVSVSSDNLVVISSADDLCFIRSFKIDKLTGKVEKVVICKGFGIINFLVKFDGLETSKILAYSVNGEFIGVTSLNLNIIQIVPITCCSNDLDLLAFADDKNRVYVINAFELDEIMLIKEVESQITSLNFFAPINQQQQLVIGTEMGILHFCYFNL